MWKSNSELGYPENYCGDAIEQTQEWEQPRVDGAGMEATSRRWCGIYTPSSRCSYGDDVASMALGVRNLISTQVEPGEKLMVDEFPFMVPRPHEDFDSDDERFIRQVVAEEEARRAEEAALDEEGFMD